MMNDDLGQQRLHAAELRVSPAGEQQSVATRVEAAQEGPDKAMRQALAASSAREASAASSARNVKPRVEVSWEDSTDVCSRMEDMLPSRKRVSEEMGPPDNPSLNPADESMGISEMAGILMSLCVAPAKCKVPNGFAETDLAVQPSAWASSAAS